MICDKCGQEVPLDNDATAVESFAYDNPFAILFNQSRHFLPVKDENGNIICEGSPSRAQYILGQPRDTRGYKYIEENEEKWRNGYAKALEAAKEINPTEK